VTHVWLALAPMSHCIGYDLSCSPTAPSPFPGGPAPQAGSQSVCLSVTTWAAPASLLITRLCQSRRTNYLIVALGCSAPSVLRIFNYDSVCELF
jgi:hypothetical protein